MVSRTIIGLRTHCDTLELRGAYTMRDHCVRVLMDYIEENCCEYGSDSVDERREE